MRTNLTAQKRAMKKIHNIMDEYNNKNIYFDYWLWNIWQYLSSFRYMPTSIVIIIKMFEMKIERRQSTNISKQNIRRSHWRQAVAMLFCVHCLDGRNAYSSRLQMSSFFLNIEMNILSFVSYSNPFLASSRHRLAR